MPFKKGQSGNPKGRPKRGTAMSDIIRSLGSQDKRRHRLAEVLWQMALEGNIAAARLLLEYHDGKPIPIIPDNTNLIELKTYHVISPEDWDEQGKDEQGKDEYET